MSERFIMFLFDQVADGLELQQYYLDVAWSCFDCWCEGFVVWVYGGIKVYQIDWRISMIYEIVQPWKQNNDYVYFKPLHQIDAWDVYHMLDRCFPYNEETHMNEGW